MAVQDQCTSDMQKTLESLGADDYLRARLGRWTPLGQVALVNLTRTLALGINKFKEVAEWVDEVALRDGVDAAGLLSTPEVLDILGDVKQSVPLKQKELRQYFFKLRFPQWARLRDQLDTIVSQARLPSDVSVQLPDNFERNEIRVQFVARSTQDFKERLQKLQNLDVERMFQCLSSPS